MPSLRYPPVAKAKPGLLVLGFFLDLGGGVAISRADLVPDQSADSEARVTELRMRYRSLTARERQVMAGVIAGRLNKQIAYTLRIAERTTKAHRSRVMHKMAVRSVAELLRIHSDLAARGEPLDAWREP